MIKVKKKMRIGIIGLGKMGLNHLNVLGALNSVDIVFLNDIKNQIQNLGKYSKFLKHISFVSNLKIDAIIIATPTSTHFNIIKKVGKYVKNIFIEKPLAQNFKETKKIISYAKNEKINLKTGFIERFNPAIISLMQIIKKKDKKIFFNFMRASPVSDRIKDVDVVTDLMVHDIDLSIFFNGKVKKIKSYGYKKKNMIAHANVMLTHANGVMTNLLASRITQKKIRHINVTLDKKYIVCDLLRKELDVFTNTVIKTVNNKFNYKSISETIETGHKEPLLIEMQAFIDSCSGIKSKFLSDGADSHEVMRVCEKIRNEIEYTN